MHSPVEALCFKPKYVTLFRSRATFHKWSQSSINRQEIINNTSCLNILNLGYFCIRISTLAKYNYAIFQLNYITIFTWYDVRWMCGFTLCTRVIAIQQDHADDARCKKFQDPSSKYQVPLFKTPITLRHESWRRIVIIWLIINWTLGNGYWKKKSNAFCRVNANYRALNYWTSWKCNGTRGRQ